MTDTSSVPHEPTAGSDTKYMLIAGGLLVLIIASLSVLWLRERSRRIEAETAVVQLDMDNKRLQDVMGKILLNGPEEVARPVRREDLPVEIANVNGEDRTLLHISAAAGERLGFAEGDLVCVGAKATGLGSGPAPATRRSAAP